MKTHQTYQTACNKSTERTVLSRKGAIVGLLLLGTLVADAGQGPQPSICNRSCWGARASWGCANMSTLNRAMVHHTAGTADYTTDYETGKARVRTVQNMHMDINGWCDIGYHFVINAGGHIYEGRYNSMAGLPIGTHDGCYVNSFGFSVLGYYHPPYNQSFTAASRSSLEAVIAWRMPSAWSPYGTGTYCGATVGFLDGHRAVGATACPGDIITAQIPGIRDGVNARKNPLPPPPPPSTLKAPCMMYSTGPGTFNTYRWSSTGSAFALIPETSHSGYGLSAVGQHVVSCDVNGDGRADNVTAMQYPNNTMRLHVFLNGYIYQGDNGWFQSGSWLMSSVNGRMVAGDFNGDGKGDVAMFYDHGDGSTMTGFRFLSTGSSFVFDSFVKGGYNLGQVADNMAAADVNSDGKTDIITAYQYPNGTIRLHVWLNGNSYQGDAGWWVSGSFLMSNVDGRMVGGDFNGDGKGDVNMMYASGSSSIVLFRFLSTGSGFNFDTSAMSGFAVSNVGKHVAAGDINGDGKADLVAAYQYPDGSFRYHPFLDGALYTGDIGWFQSGWFSLGNVGGRMTMGNW